MFKFKPLRLLQKPFELLKELLDFIESLFWKIEISESRENNQFLKGAVQVLPLVGYFMIFMTLIDCVATVFPPNFRNPEWELSTLSVLSDQSWAFLIGLGFVLTSFFQGSSSKVRRIEIRLISLIRWFLLLWGLGFLLSLVLVFTNTNRIASQIKTEFSQQTKASQELIGNVEINLDRVTDKNQLLQVVQTLGMNLTNADTLSADQIKQTIREQLPQISESLPKQADRAQGERLAILFKRSSRLTAQLIIIALVNILVWFKVRNLGFLLF